ncbi:hypothetical protein [Tenacibaculum sp. nBUS_03]|uniref:hypothetical protein n=1 Tax=Tenacibaculum sp. nBUS_03 TaxID=3395320 RepID=UPI003EC11D02
MANPYDDIFEDSEERKAQSRANTTNFSDLELKNENHFISDEKESLDEVLENIELFKTLVGPFQSF